MKIKIQKTDNIIIIFYVFLAISFTIGIIHITSTFDTTEQVILFPQPVTDLLTKKMVNVNQEEAFLIMTDIKNYPKMLPKNIISASIINQNNNNILAEYELVEHGVHAKLLVSHTMYPYDKHIVEVMDGDAKGTKLIQDFTTVNAGTIVPPECIDRDTSGDGIIDEIDMQICKEYTWKEEGWGDCPFLDECTKIDSTIELNFEGLLSPFSYLPKRNLEHASDTVISTFTDYMEIKTENGRIVDELYREILLRPADKEALEYWGTLLENGTMTVDNVRTEILNSDEGKLMIALKEMKTVEELDNETKRIIDELYREILLRPADKEAFEYWGTLLENEIITKIELRKDILKSQEGISLFTASPQAGEITESITIMFHEVYEINGPYHETVGNIAVGDFWIFDPRIDQSEFKKMLDTNKYRLYTEEITFDELRLEFEQLKENGIDLFVDDLESVNEQFLDWQKRFVDKTDDFCYVCKWVLPNEN